MARTVQRSRRCCLSAPPRIAHQEIQHQRLERNNSLDKKRKLNKSGTIPTFNSNDKKSAFSDVVIINQIEENTEHSSSLETMQQNYVSDDQLLVSYLCGKLNHVRHDQKCSPLIPEVRLDFKYMYELNELELVKGEVEHHHLTDQKCSDEYKELAMSILQEFEQDEQLFDSNILSVTRSNADYDNNSGLYIDGVTTEYRMCGKQCIFKYFESVDVIFLLINKYEYIYMGQTDEFLFYGMPGLKFCKTDHNSPGLINTSADWEERHLMRMENYELMNEQPEEPNIIPLTKILSHARQFIASLLNNQSCTERSSIVVFEKP